jgi:hypothetical protein
VTAPGREIGRALVRFNAHVLGSVLAVLSAVTLFTATVVLVLSGGENPGPMLGLLGHFLPGYSVSFAGALIGAVWVAVAGYALGAVLALCYGPWLLSHGRGDVSARAVDDHLEVGVTELPPLFFGLVSGGLLALGLFVATGWLWLRYGVESPTLGLLSNYLPGYRTDLVGGLIGAAWLFLYGSIAAASVAWIYDAVVALRRR